MKISPRIQSGPHPKVLSWSEHRDHVYLHDTEGTLVIADPLDVLVGVDRELLTGDEEDQVGQGRGHSAGEKEHLVDGRVLVLPLVGLSLWRRWRRRCG